MMGQRAKHPPRRRSPQGTSFTYQGRLDYRLRARRTARTTSSFRHAMTIAGAAESDSSGAGDRLSHNVLVTNGLFNARASTSAERAFDGTARFLEVRVGHRTRCC